LHIDVDSDIADRHFFGRNILGEHENGARTFSLKILLIVGFIFAAIQPAFAASTPYPGPNPTTLPGRIEIENYDLGGQFVGYFDTGRFDAFGGFRHDDVDVGALASASNRWALGGIAPGEWLAYTVNVSKTGSYQAIVAGTTPVEGGKLHITVDGVNVTGTIVIHRTGGWESYEHFASAPFHLRRGRHLLKVVMETGNFNLDYIDYALTRTPTPTPVDGACGSSHGATLTSAPTANLCGAGSASVISGSGPWNWSCTGSDGGASASCTALRAPLACIDAGGASHASGTTYSIQISSTPGTTTASTAQCTYGGTQPTVSTVTQSYMCNDGMATAQGNQVSTTVNNGSPTCDPPPVDGVCGAANGIVVASAPATNLCGTGTASAVSGSGPWNWSCTGSNKGTNASCSARPPASCTDDNGVRHASGATYSVQLSSTNGTTAASATQCSNGGTQPTVITVTQSYMCNDGVITAQGNQVSTTVNSGSPTCNPAPVDGACGSVNGTAVTSEPTANLCSTGTASAVSGTGPWNWSCAGSDGGQTASCAAVQTSTTTGTPLPLQGNVYKFDRSSIQEANNRAVAGDTLYFLADTYVITSPITLKSGVLYHAEAGVVLQNNTGQYAMIGNNLDDTYIDGFTINGGPGINIWGGSNVKIVNNTIQNSTVDNGFGTGNAMFVLDVTNSLIDNNIMRNIAQQGIMMYNFSTTTISKNDISFVGWNGISGNFTDTVSHTGIVVSGNTLDNIGRMGIEMGQFDVTTPGGNVPPVIGLRVTNNITKKMATRGAIQGGALVDIGLSIVVGQNGAGDSGTEIAYNTTSISGWGIEAMAPRGSVHDNNVNNDTGIAIACSPGMQVYDNIMQTSTAFLKDGGYCGGETIGPNRVNGTLHTGW
jgi:parallel beta-helix repeat protein